MQVGAIVPWNYPFHNVFNPLTAALFAGNALVIKVSASSWHIWRTHVHGGVQPTTLQAQLMCVNPKP